MDAAVVETPRQAPPVRGVPARRLRIAYMAGPGNVLRAYQCLERGEKDAANSHVGYSELMLRACRSAGASDLLALTTNDCGGITRSAPMRFGDMTVQVERFEDDFVGHSGLGYHAASFKHALRVRKTLERFRPDVLVVSDDPQRATALHLMVPLHCKLVRVHHCALTPIRMPRKLQHRVLLGIDSVAAPRFDAVLSASQQVSDQIRALWPKAPIAEFLPHFDPELHVMKRPMPSLDGGLRCVFVGRMLRSKGIFDLLEAAKLLRASGARVFMELCGDGEDFSELKRLAEGENLGERFVLHGWCDRARMQEVMARAHVGLVPTRSEFVEGFNQAAIELLLRGLPIVTADTIPAAEYVSAAARIVARDNPSELARELTALASSDALERAHRACGEVTEKFLRADTSYQAAMEHVLTAFASGRPVTSRAIGFDGTVRRA